MDIDSIVESLWLRALDLTSKDFKSEKAYLTGKVNYENLAKQALQSYIDTKIIKARINEDLYMQKIFDNISPTTVINGTHKQFIHRYFEERLTELKLKGGKDA